MTEEKPEELESVEEKEIVSEEEELNDGAEYIDRSILLLEPEGIRRDLMVDLLAGILPGASIQVTSTPEEALIAFEENEYDTCVLDLQIEGYSKSEFVKAVNNTLDAILVAFTPVNMDPDDVHNRLKLEPLRKLFDVELKK